MVVTPNLPPAINVPLFQTQTLSDSKFFPSLIKVCITLSFPLNRFSEAAQTEIFSGIKFYCSICGMRFVRNLTLKEHLNNHFEHNLALKKRGDRTMARDQFLGFSDFVAPRKHVIKQDGK